MTTSSDRCIWSGGLDPYDRDQYPGSDRELYREYFACTLENIRSVTGFQALGHLDNVVRYGHGREKEYSYRAYADVIDEILRELICRGIALEVNSGGLKYGLGFPNPHPDVLKRYRELGGELVTVGSDRPSVRSMWDTVFHRSGRSCWTADFSISRNFSPPEACFLRVYEGFMKLSLEFLAGIR